MNYKKMNYKEINFHKKIQELLKEQKYVKVEKYLRNYFNKTNNDNKNEYLLLSFVQSLRENEKFEEAIDVAIPMLYSKNRNYFLYELILIYISLNEIEEAYKYFCLLKNEDEKIQEKFGNDFDVIKNFLATKLYTLDPIKYEKYHYFKMNPINLDVTIDHIINEHSFENHPIESSYFNSNINIYELVNKINQKLLNDDLKQSIKDVSKYYYFKLNQNIGISENKKNCNTILVIATWDNDILTMYPVHNIENSKLNLFHEQEEENSLTKVKRKSQIEKFNQKYNL